MNHNRRQIRYSLIALSLLIIISGAISIATSGQTSARYKQVQSLDTATVTVNADLAETLAVLEHRAARKADGSYELKTGENPVSSNSYELMPGVSVDKDPYVLVTGKSDIPAYLYIEMNDATGQTQGTFHFTVDVQNWMKLDDANGRENRVVYVYAPGGTPRKMTSADMTNGKIEIGILDGDKVNVTEKLDRSRSYDSCIVEFYAVMIQAATDDYSDLYNTQIAS